MKKTISKISGLPLNISKRETIIFNKRIGEATFKTTISKSSGLPINMEEVNEVEGLIEDETRNLEEQNTEVEATTGRARKQKEEERITTIINNDRLKIITTIS